MEGLEIRRVRVGIIRTNCYILFRKDREDCVVVDPGDESRRIREAMEGRKLSAILLTHGHFDHIGATRDLAEPGVENCIHEADAQMLRDPSVNGSLDLIMTGITGAAPTRLLREGDELAYGGMTFQVLHTPGHSPGSVCYRLEDQLFTGDTLMAMGPGRTDLWGGSDEEMDRSLQRILHLTGIRTLWGGHG